jgi:MFS family permease
MRVIWPPGLLCLLSIGVQRCWQLEHYPGGYSGSVRRTRYAGTGSSGAPAHDVVLSRDGYGGGIADGTYRQVPLGHWSDRIGRKPFVVGGLLLMTLATLPIGLVRTSGWLAGTRVLQGVASAEIAAPTFALAADLSRRGGEGRQMSVVTTGFGLGIALGTLIAGGAAVVSL